jgi:hypothetical protein
MKLTDSNKGIGICREILNVSQLERSCSAKQGEAVGGFFSFMSGNLEEF